MGRILVSYMLIYVVESVGLDIKNKSLLFYTTEV